MAQTTVTANLGFGSVGSIYSTSPLRVVPGVLNSADAANNVFGRAFSVATAGDGTATGTVSKYAAGGTSGLRMAIMVSPKEQVSLGTTAGGSLAASLALPNGEVSSFLTMGEVVVSIAGAVALTDAVKYNTTTGVIGTGAPGGGEAVLTGAKFTRWANAAAGLAVLEMTA